MLEANQKVVVVGAGAWGGWCAYNLQKAGLAVTLIDKQEPGNALSGSGGITRVIRMAYGGSQIYTDMASISFKLWGKYCTAWEQKLLHEKEAVWMFRNTTPYYARLAQPLMESRGYALNEVSLDNLGARYPQVNLGGITSAFIEPKAGYLEASRSCKVVKKEFEKIGGVFEQAEITRVIGEGLIEGLVTREGRTLVADHYVFACGPWMQKLFPQLGPLIHISRQEVYYFEAPENHLDVHLPIWLEFRGGSEMYYGIPDHFNQGFKIAYDARNWPLDIELEQRSLNPEILKKMKSIVGHRFPILSNAPLLKHHVCVYENSPDGDFIIDQAFDFANGTMLCGSSGHGFKMGPAIGEMVAKWLIQKRPLPSEFGLRRFSKPYRVKSQFEVRV